MSDSAYAFSLTTFSPQGKLIQIEYAMQTVNKGGTALGIKAKDGICIATEKRTQPLQDTGAVQKIQMIDEHVGAVHAGIFGDARVLFTQARRFCQVYRSEYGQPMPIGQLVRKLADIMQEYTQSNGVRPFGCSLLIAGADSAGNHLYQVDPSGLFITWKATSIGSGSTNAKVYLEKRYSAEMEVEDATHTAIRTLKEGFDGKMDSQNIELAKVENGKFTILPPSDIEEYLQELE
eukprot:TRINITY_DN47749_c0_g1_i1.p1 TRINITY_DN47749_c0_g1~~TRINITY_DN47749_c0_g1_i1.p1  ORF type:complete len:250 (+),score=76.82 TRINITY_DN47749_c0_g1_i1:51-752(+)